MKLETFFYIDAWLQVLENSHYEKLPEEAIEAIFTAKKWKIPEWVIDSVENIFKIHANSYCVYNLCIEQYEMSMWQRDYSL